MHIIADVNKISKTVQRNLAFILNVLSETSIHFYLAFNSSALLCVTMRERASTFAATIWCTTF